MILDMLVNELMAKQRAVSCEHKHIIHETKRRTLCKGCGSRMVRSKGDWRAVGGAGAGGAGGDEDEDSVEN